MEKLNTDPKCVAIMMKLHKEWDIWTKERKLKILDQKSLLIICFCMDLLAYFRTVLEVLKHNRATIKPKKFKCFQEKCEFLSMHVAAGGTQPTHSKNEAFSS